LWALPILAITGIPMSRVMGFMVVTFLIALDRLRSIASASHTRLKLRRPRLEHRL
jgi:hypothetical protein